MGTEFGDDEFDYFGRVGESAEIGTNITQKRRDEYMKILYDAGRKLSYMRWLLIQ